ncbi:MAG: hypothetical protein GY937_20170 [bacterium]|nr:hypothetical protein [bacterium]
MKFSEIVTEVNSYLGRSSTVKGSWEDDEIKNAINSAQGDAERIIDGVYEYYFFGWKTIQETDDQTVYNLPEDCKKVVSLERITDDASANPIPFFLTKIQHTQADREFYQFITSQTPWRRFSPQAYQQMGQSQIRLMVPSDSSKGATLLLTYVRMLQKLVSDNDVSGIPVNNHKYLKWAALEELLSKEEEGGARMAYVTRKVQKEETLLEEHVRRVNIQAPKTINFVEPWTAL